MFKNNLIFDVGMQKRPWVYNHPKIVKLMKEKQEPGASCKWRRFLQTFSD